MGPLAGTQLVLAALATLATLGSGHNPLLTLTRHLAPHTARGCDGDTVTISCGADNKVSRDTVHYQDLDIHCIDSRSPSSPWSTEVAWEGVLALGRGRCRGRGAGCRRPRWRGW